MSTITIEEIERDPAAFLARVKSGASMVLIGDQRPVAEVRALPTAIV